MGSKGSSSNSSGNSFGFSSGTSTYTPNPQAQAAFQQSLGLANNAVSKPYEPYGGQMVAGFTPDQMSAQQGVRNLQGMAQPYFNTATNLQQQAVDYSNPNNFNEYSLNQYTNPYQKSVVDATMANLLQNEQQALQGADKRAALSGTFGGSGQFLGRAEVTRQQALANAQTLAQLNQSNYQQAQNQYNQQQAQAIQTAQSAAYGLGQLGNMAQQSALTGLNALSASGAQQQALGQQQLTGAYNHWLAQKAYPYQQAAFYSDIAAGIAPQMGGTTTYSGINMGQQQSQSRQSGGGGGGLGGIMSLASMLPFADGGAVKGDEEEPGFGSLREHRASGGATADQNSSSSDDTAQLAQINERLINTIGPQNLEQQARQRWVSQAPAQTAQAAGFVFPANLMRTAAEGGVISDELVDPDYELADEIGQHRQHHLRQHWVNKKLDPKSYEVSEVGFVIPEILMPREGRDMGGGLFTQDPVDYAKQFQGSERQRLARQHQIDKRLSTVEPKNRVSRDAGGGLVDMISKNSLLAGSPLQGNLGDVAKVRPANNAINNLPAEARKDFHFLNPAQNKSSVTNSEAMKAVSQAQHAASEAGKGGGGSGGGGGAPKMPAMKGKKASGNPTADALGENSPAGDTSNGATNDTSTDSNQPNTSSDSLPSEYTAAPEDVPSAPEIDTNNLGDMASPDIAGGGFGGFEFPMMRKGGRVRRAGGGGSGGGSAAGAASATATLGSFADTPALLGSNATLGDLAMNGKLKPSDIAGFGNLKASQGKFTGDNLVNDWMSQYRANYKGGPQKTPEQQGMPSLPGQDWYKTPLNVSDLSIGSPGKSNPGGISYTPIATGMSMNGGLMMAPMFTPPTNGSDYNDTTKMFKAPPTNGKVEGYYTGLGSQQVNPDTGLFNVNYLGPYFGGFYKGGGRVGMKDGGSFGNFYNSIYNALLTAARNFGAPHPEALAHLGAAQSMNETGGGKHAPGNNYFGIKGKGGSYPTKEVVNGKTINTRASFRSYPSMQHSANDYVKLLATRPNYRAVWNAETPQKAINAQAHSGYATDPKYGVKLAQIHALHGSDVGPMRNAFAQPVERPTSFTRAPEGQRWTTAGNFNLTNPPPSGSVLNRINPADPSGPLLGDATGVQQAQLPVTQRVADTNRMIAQPIIRAGLALSDFNPIGRANAEELPRNNNYKGPSATEAMPRIDSGSSSASAQRALDQQNSIPSPALFDTNPAIADAQGTSTLDETGKVSKQPGFIVDQNANSLFGDLGLGGDVVRPMRMPSANVQPTGFEGLQLNPFSPDEQPTAAPATNQTSPAPRSAQPEHSNTCQSNTDWRNAEPWKSDPIGGAFDSLMGDASGSESPADKSNGFEGFDLPDFDFARGGTVRRGYAIGGELAESSDFGDLSDNPLSALGEGMSNIGNSIGEGLGSLFNSDGQPRTPRREVALTENKPSEPVSRQSDGFGSIAEDTQQSAPTNAAVALDNTQQRQQGFGGLGILPTHGFLGDGTSYEMTPFRKGLLAAGLATMASHQASPLAALGEGASHGMGVWQNAQEDYDAQQLKQQRLRADQDFARRIAYPGSTQPTTTAPDSEQSAAPEKTAAPAEKTSAPSNDQSRIDELMQRRQQILSIPTTSPAQERLQQKTARNLEWEINNLQRKKDTGQTGCVGIIGRDEYNRPVYGYTTGPKSGRPLELVKTAAPDSSLTNQPAKELKGEEFLATLPEGMAARVKAIAEGREPMPKESNATRATLDAVHRYDPSANNQRFQMRQEFTSEKGGSAGSQITSANAATAHALTALEYADKMKNFDINALNRLWHGVAGQISDPAAVGFKESVSNLTKEVEKYFKGSPPADSAEKRALDHLNTASTPAEYVTALRTIAELMSGKSKDLEYRWKQTMGDQDLGEVAGSRYKFFNPKAKVAKDVIEKRYHELYPDEKPFEERYADEIKKVNQGNRNDVNGEVTVAPKIEIPPADKREVNKVYTTPKGNFIWNGQGWLPAEGAQQ